ncbi:MAG TPA: thioesterase family protein [Candidatus Sulfotelmatobacter sp.]|nr:thioesterase family protein [Candidatus Sulfotelmatobacter sp.]
MRPPTVALEKIRALEPVCLRMTVPESYRDANGHMNMRWYSAIFDEAGDALYLHLGLTPEYHRAHKTGTFDLEHHTYFVGEVFPADVLAIHVRVIGRSAKRFHYLMFMVNETRGTLAAIFECMNTFADLTSRRTAPYPAEIAARIQAAVAADAGLDWPPPVAGAMQA